MSTKRRWGWRAVELHPAGRPPTNWAGNVVFAAAQFRRPATVAQLQAVVARARHVRVLGTGHSFNDIADSPGVQVSLAGLPPEVEVDSAAPAVRVAAGLSYARLAPRLDAAGFGLRTMASLPHISVAGACATATHGSGAGNQNLAAAVTAMEMVTASGDLVTLRRGEDGFDGAVVHLGALGAVVSLTLQVVPSFDVAQRVYEDLPLAALEDHFADVMSAGHSVSLFTDWRGPRLTQVWVKQRVPLPGTGPGPRSGTGSRARPGTGPRLRPAGPAANASSLVHRPARAGAAPSGARHAAGRHHRPARRPRPLVRPAAAFPARVHPERGRRTPVGVPAPGPARGASHARGRRGPGPGGPGAADLRGPRRRRGRAVAQPQLPRRHRGDPLHLEARRRRGAAGAAPAGAAPGPVRGQAALGQAVRRPAGSPPLPLPAAARLPRSHAAVRPGGQVPQCLRRPLPGRLARCRYVAGSRPAATWAAMSTRDRKPSLARMCST